MMWRNRFNAAVWCVSVRYLSVNELEVLISREEIAGRVAEIGKQITADSAGEAGDSGGLCRLHYSGQVCRGLRAGLRGTVSESAGYLCVAGCGVEGLVGRSYGF